MNSTKDKIHVEALTNNIKQYGLLAPIIVKKKKDGRYSIVVGRYRTQACKELGWTKIPAKVRNIKDKVEATAISITENTHRLDYDLDERIEAILAHFIIRGYTYEQIAYWAKKIHLFGNKGVPESFLEALDASGYAPNSIYQIMQTVLYLSSSVLKVAQQERLSLNKRQMLSHRKLREHPKIAIKLAKEIAELSEKRARIRVRQEIRYLETGATVQQGNSYIFDESRRENVNVKKILDKHPAEYYLELVEAINDLMYLSIGYKLNQEQITYEPKHIENTEKHRIEILKGLTKNELLKLENDMYMLRHLFKLS